MGRLDEVIAGITEAIHRRQGLAVAEVTTAEPLAADERAALQRVLESKVGKRLELRESVDDVRRDRRVRTCPRTRVRPS